jgi:hypothetical protein
MGASNVVTRTFSEGIITGDTKSRELSEQQLISQIRHLQTKYHSAAKEKATVYRHRAQNSS